MKRRLFLSNAGLAAGAMLAPRASALTRTSEPRIAVIGLNGRGRNHIQGVLGTPKVRLAAICDCDANVLERERAKLEKEGVKVATFTDYRELCEAKDIDAVTIATPNHTHALITLAAAGQGKHVYVEKPVSHNVHEGRLLAEAQEQHGVVIQHGFQRRSEAAWAEALGWIGEGHLGALKVARGFCYKPRKSIGKVDGPQKPPQGVDYSLWCGPRETLPIDRERFHYDWHWQFPWGNGDLGNQGPHQLDVCRWALGDPAELPRSVYSAGDRFAHDDDGDWANTQIVHLDYAKAPILFEVRGLPKRDLDYSTGMDDYRGQSIGNVIEYEGGALLGGHGPNCVAVDDKGKTIRKFTGGGSHYQTWVDAIFHGNQEPGRGAESGHLSSALAHIGNISWRLAERTGSQSAPDLELVDEALERMKKHLAANGVDLAKHPIQHGPRLSLAPGQERFQGEHAELANPMLSESSREGFEVEV